MKPVAREDLLDWVTYSERRDELRARAMAEKDRRRVHVGENLTFLFENALTVRYQIQEMMRAERIVREGDIAHEIETYNELLGGPGEIGCTLLVEIEEAEERAPKLEAWRALPESLYARLEDGRRVRARFDERQRGEDRLSAVQYLKFPTGGEVPVALGTDLAGITAETSLSPDQREALREDLGA